MVKKNYDQTKYSPYKQEGVIEMVQRPTTRPSRKRKRSLMVTQSVSFRDVNFRILGLWDIPRRV